MRDDSGDFPVDPNPFFGRVAYAYGHGIDRPLSVVRMGYEDLLNSAGAYVGHWTAPAFAVFPLWNSRGQGDFGVFANGKFDHCVTVDLCVRISWPGTWFDLARPGVTRNAWHGTLLEDKQDAAGTLYRRNRSYDPRTGQFTQEDPIGLAGGLNSYGFADGDPVSYSDPYGLCPAVITGRPCTLQDAANFAAGFGDAASFGLTSRVRQNTPGGDGVQYESGLYTAGMLTGATVAIIATSGTGSGTLAASAEAHVAPRSAAAAGRSWTTQRRAFWRGEAGSAGAVERWGAENVGRMERGLAPQVRNPRTGRMESVELHHAPVPRRDGGRQVRPVTPDQHRAVDPFRQ